MPRDARQVRSRAALHAAMLELLAERPFEAITVKEITDRAGVGYATFFRHYPTKEALLEDAVAGEIRHMVGLTLVEMDRHDAIASCELMCRHVDGNRPLWTALLSGRAHQTVREELIRISVEVAETRATGWPPVAIGTRISAGAIIDILSWWLTQAPDTPQDKVVQLLYELAVGPAMRRAT